MNSHVILAVECVGIPVASALSQNIEALQVTLATLPKDHTSYRAFSLDIEQLQRDIALYVSGEAQKSQVSNAASIERDIGALINDRVAEYGSAGIPGGKALKKILRDAMAQNLQSYPEYSNIENRYRGLFARIHGAIGKLNRKSSDSISPRTPGALGHTSVIPQTRAYERLNEYRRRLDRILSNIRNTDKSRKTIIRAQIETIARESANIADTEGDEVATLKQAISILASNCLSGLQRDRGRDNRRERSGSSDAIREPNATHPKNPPIDHLAPQKTPVALSPYAQSVVQYLNTFLNAIRNVTAKDKGSQGDGPMRQNAVSPILRELIRLIEAGSIKSGNFSWEKVISLCGNMTHAYGKNLKNALAKENQRGNLAMNLQILYDTIMRMRTPNLTLAILCNSISQYLTQNPPPTR